MAIIKGCFYADTLSVNTRYTAILPDKLCEEVSVLYLLHGRSGNADSWLNQTGLIRYLKDLPIVVFCPEVGLSYYQDTLLGGQYWQYLTKEFPKKMRGFHQFEVKQEFVAGNSMGGYGALTWLLSEPKRFTAGGLFSPLINPENLLGVIPEAQKELMNAFGTIDFRTSEKNLINQTNFEKLPIIFHQCGSSDFLFDDSLEVSRCLNKNDNYTLTISQGKHDWDEWDQSIQKFISMMASLP